MLVSDLDFDLPPRLIAQEPARPRDAARLMHVRCSLLPDVPRAISHRRVRDLPEILRPGDLLVVNDTRVLRARLRGEKALSGGRVEAMLLREEERNLWEVLLRPSARLKPGAPLRFVASDPSAPPLRAEAVERRGGGWMLRFLSPEESEDFDVRQVLEEYGEVPLPPYIQASASEDEYQTVYARSQVLESGETALDSCAAPTAGLHFTPELLQRLHEREVEIAKVTLGVGPGTFRPVQSETLEEHVMHEEEFFVPQPTAMRINEQKARGGRVIAVGTTSARTLESAVGDNNQVRAGLGSTRLFVRPPHEFRVLDALLTNFHLPRSTLLALVAAWVQHRACRDDPGHAMIDGLQATHEMYARAVEEGYRFFSFGDAMLLE